VAAPGGTLSCRLVTHITVALGTMLAVLSLVEVEQQTVFTRMWEVNQRDRARRTKNL
jgi:hypothetical protein